MTLEWIKELLKLNRKDDEIDFRRWEEICRYTGMTDDQLKYTILCLLDSMSTKYVNSQVKIKYLENKISILETDIETLKKNNTISDYELNKARVKQGVPIARKPQADKEVILALRERGLTYEEIADKLNISRTTVWRHLKE